MERHEKLRLWGQWILASFAAIALFEFLANTTVRIGVSYRSYFFLIFLVLISGFQWLFVLRSLSFVKPWGWVIATTIGYILGGVGSIPATQSLSLGLIGLIIGGIIWGGVLGSFQWLVLRHKFAKSGLWVLANIIGFSIWVPLILTGISDGRILGEYLLTLFTGGITGVVLVWLVQQHSQDNPIT